MRARVRPPAVLAACAAFALGCAGSAPAPEPVDDADADAIEAAVYERAQAERSEFFEREVERLRADLRQAEESIVALESGLRQPHSRADAVSAVAEARIALDRVSRDVPWRADRVAEAREKVDEAARQLDAGHIGAAIFFASRAQRVTDSLRAEARQVALWDERHAIRGARVHLRAGPSLSHRIVAILLKETPVYPERRLGEWTLVRTPDGRIGWVFSELLRDAPQPASRASRASGSANTTQSLPSALAR